MKKFMFTVCMILGSCAFIGCNGNGTAQSEEKDSVVVDSLEVVDSIEVVDSVVSDSTVCPD